MTRLDITAVGDPPPGDQLPMSVVLSTPTVSI
jgi:hypothetical protein